MRVLADAVEPAELLDGRPASFRRRLRQHQRGSRRRIDLVTMMHLEDLDVPVRPEPCRRLFDQILEEIDPQRRVRCIDDRYLAARLFDHPVMLGRQAGRSHQNRNVRGDRTVKAFAKCIWC